MADSVAQQHVQRIGGILKSTKVDFTENSFFSGVDPDFLIRLPDDRSVIVEAKEWRPTPENEARAIEQARLYRDLLGAHAALFVLPGLQRSETELGLVREEDLADVVEAIRKQSTGHVSGRRERLRRPSVRERGAMQVFAAMPFSATYDDTFFVAMAAAARQCGAGCVRIDQEEFQGDIVEEIERQLRLSKAAFVDLSELKPNVLYEAGFAHALQIPCIHICSTPLSDLPFDVRNWNTISYTKGQTNGLVRPLAKRLGTILNAPQEDLSGKS